MTNKTAKPLRGEALKHFDEASALCDELKKTMDAMKLKPAIDSTEIDECIKLTDRLLRELDHTWEHL